MYMGVVMCIWVTSGMLCFGHVMWVGVWLCVCESMFVCVYALSRQYDWLLYS